jgi:hypothetical protein
MGNHYHLQLESREANLSQAIQWLNVSYSVWLNRKYRRIGPLFQGRFKAILHEPSEALMINRYNHLNPVRLKALGGHETRHVGDPQISVQLARQRVDALEQYPWSSYAFFAGTGCASFYGATATNRLESGEEQERLKDCLGHKSYQQSARFGIGPGKNCYLLAAAVHVKRLYSSPGPVEDSV